MSGPTYAADLVALAAAAAKAAKFALTKECYAAVTVADEADACRLVNVCNEKLKEMMWNQGYWTDELANIKAKEEEDPQEHGTPAYLLYKLDVATAVNSIEHFDFHVANAVVDAADAAAALPAAKAAAAAAKDASRLADSVAASTQRKADAAAAAWVAAKAASRLAAAAVTSGISSFVADATAAAEADADATWDDADAGDGWCDCLACDDYICVCKAASFMVISCGTSLRRDAAATAKVAEVKGCDAAEADADATWDDADAGDGWCDCLACDDYICVCEN